MRTNSKKNAASALFGQVRQAILALLFTHSDESYYVREIARITGGGLGAVHRELDNLAQAELVVRTRRGRQVYYQANTQSPVFADLRALLVKTLGVADVLRSALAPLADRIAAAFIYGSVARGGEKSDSDVDVMVVGAVEFGEVVRALTPAQDQLRREINPSVFTLSDFNKRLENREHFISSVMRAPRVMLMGDDSEFRTMA